MKWITAIVLAGVAIGATRRPTARARPAFAVAAVNDAKTQAAIRPESSGAAVLRMQILLDRAHYSPGEIDGHCGDNLKRAITSYQAAHSGEIWGQLNSDTAPALVPYTIADTDVAGPFEAVPADMMEQSKMKSLGYQSADELLGEKFHISPALLAKLNPGKDLHRAGEEILVPNVQHDPLPAAALIVVSKNSRTVETMDAAGKVLAHYPATVGSEHDPLPIGEWKVTGVQKNPAFFYNPDLFWDAKAEDSRAKIPPGPNNPVGLVWIGISKEHYGIHGSPEPGKIGHTESHGCIRLTNWDAEELAKMVKPGVRVTMEE